ncbi:MAG: chemotaxis protein CheW [Acidiferrobacterales bacterium]
MSSSQVINQSVHTLLVPTTAESLLIPSAVVAEVVTVSNLIPLPAGPDWCSGLITWRSRALPVISIEVLTGRPYAPPGPRSKLVVFFPLPGCHESQFFAIQSLTEPQPNNISDTKGMVVKTPSLPIAASALNLDGVIGIIPDLVWLKETLYPAS